MLLTMGHLGVKNSRSCLSHRTDTLDPLNSDSPFSLSPQPQATPILPSISLCWTILCHRRGIFMPQGSRIMQYLSFRVWLISPSTMSSRFIHMVACGRVSFLRLNYTRLCVQTLFPRRHGGGEIG